MLFCWDVLPQLNGASLKALDNRLHPRPSAAGYATLPMGHAALFLEGAAVGFVHRSTDIGALGFLKINGVYISASASLLSPYRLKSLQMRF
jgi:hypothetical protein